MEIKTNLFRKSYADSEGRKQAKILVKIGYLSSTKKFRELKRIEISIFDKAGNPYKFTDVEFNHIKNQINDVRIRIFEIEKLIRGIVEKLIDAKLKINAEVVQSYMNSELEKIKIKNFKSQISNPLLGYSVITASSITGEINNTNDVNEFAINNDIITEEEAVELEEAIGNHIESKGFVTDEEIGGIYDSIGIHKSILKQRKNIEDMSLDLRYKRGYYNKNLILESFGFCWSNNPQKNEPFIATSYKSLIFQFADFIYNKKASVNIKDFNNNWVDNFLQYIRTEGYPIIKLKNYNPFNVHQFQTDFLAAKRKPYSISSFKKVIKHLKYYIKILQKNKLLDVNIINPTYIVASDYIGRNDIKDNFTRREHSLTPNEVEELISYNFKSEILSLARDMYIIQVFAGGLRTMELFDANLTIQGNYISVYRSKTKVITENPILPELLSIIKKHNGQLPVFLKVSEYRSKLKEVAELLKWNRVIKQKNMSLNSSNEVIETTLIELFKPYTARKTAVKYFGEVYSFSDSEIQEFLGQDDPKTLKHYKAKISPELKLDLLNSKLGAKF